MACVHAAFVTGQVSDQAVAALIVACLEQLREPLVTTEVATDLLHLMHRAQGSLESVNHYVIHLKIQNMPRDNCSKCCIQMLCTYQRLGVGAIAPQAWREEVNLVSCVNDPLKVLAVPGKGCFRSTVRLEADKPSQAHMHTEHRVSDTEDVR